MKKLYVVIALVGCSMMISACSGMGKMGGYHKMKMEKMFSKKDANSDGKVSKEEWMSRSTEKFTKMDTDKDGMITMEEMKAHKKSCGRCKGH